MATTNATATESATPGALIVRQVVTPVLDTGGAYAALDALHTNSLKLSRMARIPGGAGIITKIVVIDKDDQGIAGVAHFFTAETTQTANAAFAPSDAEAETCVGSASFGAAEDFNTSRVFTNSSVRLYYRCAAGSTDLYVALQTLGAPTHTASGLVLVVTAELL